MTPLEEQVEKLARELNLEAGRQRGWTDVDDWEYITEQERGGWRNMAKTAIAVLLPLEVTDESVTVTLSREEIEAIFEAMSPGYSHEGPMDQHLKAVYPKLRETRACLSAALTQKGDNE